MQTLKGIGAVYCDASFFVALFSKKDAKHKRAVKLFKEIKQNRIMIHTCWFVISEAMTVLLYQFGYSEALTFNQSIDLYKILPSTESQHHQAIALKSRSKDSAGIFFSSPEIRTRERASTKEIFLSLPKRLNKAMA
jgi:predicted nucleic acid-binding protein